jgi:hypothetical protein
MLWLSGGLGLLGQDYNIWINSLANGNESPMLRDHADLVRPLFADRYDWSEQRRILKVIDDILVHYERAWPHLVSHFSDERYCLTVTSERIARNLSVGEVCRALVVDQLAAVYRPFIPADKTAYLRLFTPEIARSDDFQAWCRAQLTDKKPFYLLQGEMCEWAVSQIHTLELPDEKRSSALRGIRAAEDTLRRTREPILTKSFVIPNFRMLFSPEMAKSIRDGLEKGK